jgi:hypothetical protein
MRRGWSRSRIGRLQLQLLQLPYPPRMGVDTCDARIANLEHNAARFLRADVIGEKRMEVVDMETCVLEWVVTKSIG